MIPLPLRRKAVRLLSTYPVGGRASQDDADLLPMRDAADSLYSVTKRGKQGCLFARWRRDPGRSAGPATLPLREPDLAQFGGLYKGATTLYGYGELTPEKIFSFGKMKVSHRESVGLIRYHRGER